MMSDNFVQRKFLGREGIAPTWQHCSAGRNASPRRLRAPSHTADHLSLSWLGALKPSAGGGPVQKESEFIEGSGLEISGDNVRGQT